MTLLERVVASHAPSHHTPKRIVLCTHAKHSVVELCRAFKNLDVELTFYPVDYSKEAKNIDAILGLGAEVIEQPKLLAASIQAADCVIEDGARISKIIQQYRLKTKPGFFSVEQTSGGIRFFRENPPPYPVINVAMSPMKLEIENRRATPEGILRHFSGLTGTLLGGKQVLLLGFGSIGEGVAKLAHALGAHITVYDLLATRRMYAQHHGYATAEEGTLDDIIASQDIIFMATNTYQGGTINPERVLLMKDGAVICNAGSGRGELAVELQTTGSYIIHEASLTIQETDANLEITFQKYNLTKSITVLAKGFPVNLHIGTGTSHDAIEVIMALLLLAAIRRPSSVQSGLQALDDDIQEVVAECFLKEAANIGHKPTYVKTREIHSLERPYGSIFPFHNELNAVTGLSMARVRFKAGSKTRGHYHRRSQESYYAEKGRADILVWPHDDFDDVEIYHVEPGDYLLVPQGYYHDVRVTSKEDFECLVIATPPFVIWDQFFRDPIKEV